MYADATPPIASIVTHAPRCAVITPVGPGHREAADQSYRSVQQAMAHSRGPFSAIDVLSIDDTKGRLGRSKARNLGLDKALEAGYKWCFFLDADDLLTAKAFAAVGPFLDGLDAVWGLIAESGFDELRPRLRSEQPHEISSYEELLAYPPYLSLQMGHFVRTRLAAVIGFDESMDAGEDFKYYLELWQRGRCRKVPEIFFVNRRGRHSLGPRSATGQQWRQVAEALIAHKRLEVEGTAVDYRKFWQEEGLRNIVPATGTPNPEGWDPVAFIREALAALRYETVLDFGCGYGRLCRAFDTAGYLGVDLNPSAVGRARADQPGYDFDVIHLELSGDLPQVDLVLAYTVLLHLDDVLLRSVLHTLGRHTARYLVIGEILGREWRRPGNPPVFNRERDEYLAVLSEVGFELRKEHRRSYRRYADLPEFRGRNTDLSLLIFERVSRP